MSAAKDNGGTRHVAVVLWMGGGGGRLQLRGISRFANTSGRRWTYEIVQNFGTLTAEHVRQALSVGVSGFILNVKPQDDGVVKALTEADVPVVAIDVTEYTPCRRLVQIRTDDTSIGAAGAEHVLSLGNFSTFGFVPDLSYGGQWSDERGRAYAKTLAKHGFPCSICPVVKSDDPNESRETIARWIGGIAKPAAVMCACDYVAARVIDVCKRLKADVPREVVVLGVDNESLCDCTKPTISSIQPDFEDEGYRTAQAMDRMLRSPKFRSTTQWCHTLGVVERDSTHPIAPAGHLVRRASAFIESNALGGIDVNDVASHLQVSRRLLDLRFHQMTGQTVHEAITRRKIEEARRRLVETDWKFTRIARFCGYASEDVLARAFLRETGETLAGFRQRRSTN